MTARILSVLYHVRAVSSINWFFHLLFTLLFQLCRSLPEAVRRNLKVKFVSGNFADIYAGFMLRTWIFQSRIYLLLPARITLLTDAHVFTIRLQLELDIWPSTCWLSTYTLSACLACFVHTDFLHAKHPLWILSIYEAYFLYTDFTLWPSTSLLYTNWLSMYDFPHLSIISRFWLYIPAFHIIGLLSVYQLSKHPLYFLTFWTHSTYPYQHANCLPPT